jgi:hypothetical protein
MTIVFALLCEDGQNAVVASDSLHLCYPPMNSIIMDSKMTKLTRVENAIISGSGRVEDFDMILAAYTQKIPFPNRTLLFDEMFLEEKGYEIDVKLWHIFHHYLKYRHERNELLGDEDEDITYATTDLLIVFPSFDKGVQLSWIRSNGALYHELIKPYLAIGMRDTFEVLARVTPWEATGTVAEAKEYANKILDFYDEHVVFAGGDRHIEVLLK